MFKFLSMLGTQVDELHSAKEKNEAAVSFIDIVNIEANSRLP